MLPKRNESKSAYSPSLLQPSIPKSRSLKINILAPEAYNQRNVLGLQGLTQWTAEEEKIHLQHNRILQKGFMHRNPIKVISDAKLAGVQWLTDCCCPSLHAAVMLNISKELVVHYKVKETELNLVAHRVYNAFLKEKKDELAPLIETLEQKRRAMMAPGGHLYGESLQKRALEMLKKNNIKTPGPEQIKAAARLVVDIERRKMTDAIVALLLKKYLEGAALSLGLSLKPAYRVGQNHDYCFLGAAGSGKSTLAKQYLMETQKTDYVILATDTYRAFTMPGSDSDEHESKVTKDVFTRTQDFAYLIKTLVEEEINENIIKRKARPSVICDCITLSADMRRLLAQGRVTSVVAAYTGEPGYIGIVERADRRAKDVDATPADKGRFMETTSLLKGHADASQQLLTSIPENTNTLVYDTNVESGAPPQKIAEIESKSQIIFIFNLKVMAEFLNKRNINIAAINQIDLIYNLNSSLHLLATHPENKAKAIIDLVLSTEYKAHYTIQIKDSKGNAYVELVPDGSNKVVLNILNNEIFIKKTQEDTIEATVLRSMFRQLMAGSLRGSFELAYSEGDRNSFQNLLKKYFEKKSDAHGGLSPRLG